MLSAPALLAPAIRGTDDMARMKGASGGGAHNAVPMGSPRVSLELGKSYANTPAGKVLRAGDVAPTHAARPLTLSFGASWSRMAEARSVD